LNTEQDFVQRMGRPGINSRKRIIFREFFRSLAAQTQQKVTDHDVKQQVNVVDAAKDEKYIYNDDCDFSTGSLHKEYE
jgi:hypothetical protein